MRRYLNQKGSAMVLVLAALMILVAVGAVIVAVSAANITMSRRYSDWSAEYYWLDYAAQDQLGDLDQNILLAGENSARSYLQDGGYQEASGSLSAQYTYLESAGMQPLIYQAWKELDDAYSARMEDPDTDPKEALKEHNEALEKLVNQAFHVVYCSYIESHYTDVNNDKRYADRDIETAVTLQNAGWFADARTAGSLKQVYNALKSVQNLPNIEIKALETQGESPKQVTVHLTAVPPSFSAVQQTRYYVVKANPLYANALSVGGTIAFEGGGTVTVQGDVVSCNADKNDGWEPLDTEEGNSNGIRAGANTAAVLFGNVYSAGDVHLTGNGGSIAVNSYEGGGASALKKSYLYPPTEGTANPFLLDLTAVQENAETFMERKVDSTVVPYLYRDETGGNVYCNNLAIESGVSSGSLSVKKNIWTRDDIQNDANGAATISVGGNYIGLSSSANEETGDPNGSSAVINNAYMFGGLIRIGGGFVIPGTSWYEFSGKEYYQTAESATAQAGEYFGAYIQGSVAEESGSVFQDYSDTSGTYSLFKNKEGQSDSSQILRDRISRFRQAVTPLEGLQSGITVGRPDLGYALGIVNNNGEISYADTQNSEDATENYLNYTEASGSFFGRVYDQKTLFFGTNGYPFSKLYDGDIRKGDAANGFYYYSGTHTIAVGGEGSLKQGILFCDGNLTLTGGRFYGSVICTGNLTLKGGVTVVYDENAVLDVLGLSGYALQTDDEGLYVGSSLARRFFSPNTYSAATSFGVEQVAMVSSTAGERTKDATRYVINSWRESRAE